MPATGGRASRHSQDELFSHAVWVDEPTFTSAGRHRDTPERTPTTEEHRREGPDMEAAAEASRPQRKDTKHSADLEKRDHCRAEDTRVESVTPENHETAKGEKDGRRQTRLLPGQKTAAGAQNSSGGVPTEGRAPRGVPKSCEPHLLLNHCPRTQHGQGDAQAQRPGNPRALRRQY